MAPPGVSRHAVDWRAGGMRREESGDVQPPLPRDFGLAPHMTGMFDGAATNAYYFVFWRRDGTVLKRSDSAGDNIPLPARPTSFTPQIARMRGAWRELYH